MRWACRTLLPARATGVPSKKWVPWQAQRRINGPPLARFESFQLCSQWRAIDSVRWPQSPLDLVSRPAAVLQADKGDLSRCVLTDQNLGFTKLLANRFNVPPASSPGLIEVSGPVAWLSSIVHEQVVGFWGSCRMQTQGRPSSLKADRFRPSDVTEQEKPRGGMTNTL
jgi:hypothetical protein